MKSSEGVWAKTTSTPVTRAGSLDEAWWRTQTATPHCGNETETQEGPRGLLR